MIEVKGKFTDAKVMIDQVEETAMSQIVRFVNDESFTNPVAIMPDCHAGAGAVIGFTMPINDRVIPNVVGVDIGCGMLSVELSVGKYSVWVVETIDKKIRRAVPFGFNSHEQRKHWVKLPYGMLDTFNRCEIDTEKALRSIGTLGGGNHFIEIGRSDETNRYWITVHSGSRNPGLRVAQYWQGVANENAGNKSELNYLEGADKDGYLFDMKMAQEYATMNRKEIMRLVLEAIGLTYGDIIREIETVHNFIDFEDNVIRKGAIRSYEGEQMIIPFNMEDGLLVCEGRSNPEWNFSAPHGAGRVYSRSKAKKELSLEDAKASMKEAGVYCSNLPLDETKKAYKDSGIIEEAIGPTAKILERVKPILNLKA